MSLGELLDLPARVAELERQVADQGADPPAARGGGSGLQGNVLTLGADGTIGADFTGHVHALGLDLDAGDLSDPPDENRVRWIKSDGTSAADLLAYDLAGLAALSLLARQGASGDATATLRARDNTGGNYDQAALVTSYTPGASAPGEVLARARTAGGSNVNAKVIDSLARSAFVQLMTAANLAVQVSAFSRTTAAAVQDGGTISFPTTFSGPAVAVLLAPSNGVDLYGWSVGSFTASGFNLVTRWLDGAARAAATGGVYLALGPR